MFLLSFPLYLKIKDKNNGTAIAVARAYRTVLKESQFSDKFDRVVFAVLDKKPHSTSNFTVFNKILGSALAPAAVLPVALPPIPLLKNNALLFSAVALLGAWITGFSLLPVVALTLYGGLLGFVLTQMQKKALMRGLQSLQKDEVSWLKENKVAYELGSRAGKAWLPYMGSFLKPQAYSSAFQIGFQKAHPQKSPRLNQS